MQVQIELAKYQGKTEAYERSLDALGHSSNALGQSSSTMNFMLQTMTQQVSMPLLRLTKCKLHLSILLAE